jgi:hypothetical protein
VPQVRQSVPGPKKMGEAHHSFCDIGNEGWVPHSPDFLRRLVALIHSICLSLIKGAHADLSSTAWQEIGSSPVFGLEWDNNTKRPGLRPISANCLGCFSSNSHRIVILGDCDFIDRSLEVIDF